MKPSNEVVGSLGDESTDFRFPELQAALYQWMREAVTELGQGSNSESIYDVRRWKRDEDGNFRDVERSVLIWKRTAIERAMQLASWSAVVAVVRDDARLDFQIDALVGTAAGRTYLGIQSVGKFILPQPNQVDHYDAVFTERYAHLEDYLARSELELSFIFPIPGLASDKFPIALEADLELDVMSDDELATALERQLIPTMFPGSQILGSDETRQACLRYHCRLPKIVGEDNPPDGDRLLTDMDLRTSKIRQDFGCTMALVVPDPVVISGTMRLGMGSLIYPSSVAFQGFPLAPKMRYRKLHLDDHLTTDLTRTWKQVRDLNISNSLALAMRRLDFQAGRERIEDEIIDILIAAEALYLTDGNHQELGFRLALRAAALSDPESLGMSRRDVFDTMKSAYGVRSKIVHGGKPKAADLQVKGVQLSIEQFVQVLEDIVRQALREALRRTGDSEVTWPPDWDDLTLPT